MLERIELILGPMFAGNSTELLQPDEPALEHRKEVSLAEELLRHSIWLEWIYYHS